MTGVPEVRAREHYEKLIDEGVDPCRDDPVMQAYMSRWDGSSFLKALGDLAGKDVLEVGVGTGRIAAQILAHGCRHFTGIDVSPKTIERARENLAAHPNVDLVPGDIAEFVRPSAFDIVCSVLTFMHVADKPRSLGNAVRSLRPGGRIVLSVAEEGDWLEYGSRRVRLHYAPPEEYIGSLEDLGCEVAEPADLIDYWVSPRGKREATHRQRIATLVQAVKICR